MHNKHIAILDGIRGLMAFWVFYGHLKMFTVAKTPLIGSAGLAVDVFMFLSGFLMALHWIERKSHHASLQSQASDFYIRRFFRVAPVYFILLAMAFLEQDRLLGLVRELKQIMPPPWAKVEAAFTKPTDHTLNWQNIASHLTFTFGLFPKYAYNNVLPDWSISLEMQFYAVFPILMWIIGRWGAVVPSVICIGLTVVTHQMVGLYLNMGPWGNFPQPAMLLFKLNIFFCGIFVAQAFQEGFKRKTPLLLACIMMFNCSIQVIVILVAITAMLAYPNVDKTLPGKLLSNRLARFLGDTSYSVYLVHMLILLPILKLLTETTLFNHLPRYHKLAIAFVAIATPVYLAGYILHRLVELPGISLGKAAVRKWMPKPTGSN